jgi:TRAP transporter TAXI family solute receptor
MASNWIGRARAGTPPFDHPIALRMASPANAGPMFFVTLADSGMRTVGDIRGKRLAVGAEGGGMTQHVHTIFGVLGISFDDFTPVYLNFPDGAEALLTGEVDVQWQCPIPNQVMDDLAGRAQVRVLPYDDGDLSRLLSEVAFYKPAVVPKGAFRGADVDSDQVGVLNVLVTHERVDEGLVRDVVAAMVANGDALAGHCPLYGSLPPLWEPLRSEGAAAFDIDGVALHPGAERAYREAGFIG